jgi:cytochrome oxidase Cu insertion factor (SCO1/SenC/PrrC family)
MFKDARMFRRNTLLWIAIVCFAPFVASFMAYYFLQPSSRVNYGDLIDVQNLPSVTLQQIDGQAFQFNALQGKWWYFTIDDADCNQYCEQKLWQIRQVRKTQGKHPERIERVWLITGKGQPSEHLQEEYAGTAFVLLNDLSIVSRLPYMQSLNDHIFLVDPLGNVVLRYPKNADSTRMRKDLERLLKVSRIG